MYSIPFSFPDAYSGFAEADGVARFDGHCLILEYQIKDAVFGMVKSEVKKVIIPVGEIAAIKFKRSTFRATIDLRTHCIEIVEEIPGQKGGEFMLSLKRKHREEGEEFASALRLGVSEARLRALEEDHQRDGLQSPE